MAAKLEGIPERLVRAYAQAEMDILIDMARKIGAADLYIPSTVFQHEKLVAMGLLYDEIVIRLAALMKRSTADIERIIRESGAAALKDDISIYSEAANAFADTAEKAWQRPTRMKVETVKEHIRRVFEGVGAAAFTAESKAFAEILEEGIRKTEDFFENLTRTTANTATRQFERALDRAYMQVTSGAFSGSTAIERAIKDLAGKGVESIIYPNGHVDTMEVAVRRAVVTGTNQTSLHLKEQLADELGLNLVEVSAHAGARPSHAVWQGGIYSREGGTKEYPNLVEVTGYGTGPGLGGWNCNHTMSPYYEGMPRAYSEELLQEYRESSVNADGKQMNRYDANQRMRAMERNIRRWKREAAALEAAGIDSSAAKAKALEWQKRWKEFSKESGIKTQGDRVATGKGLTKNNQKSTISTEERCINISGIIDYNHIKMLCGFGVLSVFHFFNCCFHKIFDI